MMSLVDVMMESAKFNCKRTAELLIEKTNDLDDLLGMTPLLIAEKANDLDDLLGMTPFLKAATLDLFSPLSSVKGPLAAGIDASIRYRNHELSLLDVASLMGHIDVVRAFLEHGVDVNDVRPTATRRLRP